MELFRLNELLICHTTSSFNKKMVCFVRSHTLAVTILYLMGIGTQIWIEIMQDLGLSGFFDTNGLVCEEIFLCLILDSRFWMNNIECIQLNTTWRLNENWSKYKPKRAILVDVPKDRLVESLPTSVTRCRNYFSNIWPFIVMKICPMATTNSQHFFQNSAKH